MEGYAGILPREANLPDMNQITLHDLSIEDYDEILTLWEGAGLSVRPEGRDAHDRFARQMADRRQRVVGLRDGARLIAVDPAYWRRGLAGRLLAEAERWFVEEQGLEIWAALIEAENRDSQALFDALDYRRHDVVYVSKRTRPEA
jgi:GNAT superfamily N-acetyltransferase